MSLWRHGSEMRSEAPVEQEEKEQEEEERRETDRPTHFVSDVPIY